MTQIDQLALAVRESDLEEQEETPSAIEMWHNGSEPRHHQIARLTALGYMTNEVATQMGMKNEAVRKVKSSPLFRAVVKELEKGLDNNIIKARKILIEAAPDAATVKVEMLKSVDPRIAGDNANDILKGVGVMRQEVEAQRGPVFNIKAEQVNLIETTLKELRDAQRG